MILAPAFSSPTSPRRNVGYQEMPDSRAAGAQPRETRTSRREAPAAARLHHLGDDKSAPIRETRDFARAGVDHGYEVQGHDDQASLAYPARFPARRRHSCFRREALARFASVGHRGTCRGTLGANRLAPASSNAAAHGSIACRCRSGRCPLVGHPALVPRVAAGSAAGPRTRRSEASPLREVFRQWRRAAIGPAPIGPRCRAERRGLVVDAVHGARRPGRRRGDALARQRGDHGQPGIVHGGRE